MANSPYTQQLRRVWVAMAIGAFGNGFTMPFLLVYLYKVQDMPLAQVGMAMGVSGLAALVAGPWLGTLIDVFGAKRSYVIGCLAQALSGVLFITMDHPWQAFVAAALSAAGHSTNFAAIQALVTGITTSELRQRIFGIQFMMINAAIGIGGVISGFLADVDRPSTFTVLFLIDIASFLITAAIVAPMKVGDVIAAPAGAAVGGWRLVLRDRMLWWMAGAIALGSAVGYGHLDAGIPAIAADLDNSTKILGFAFAANTGMIVLSQLLVLKLLAGRRRTRALMSFTVVLVLMAMVTGAGLLTNGLFAAAFLISAPAIFAVGETIWGPTLSAIVADAAPAHLRGRYQTARTTAWNGGMMFGPMLAGVLIGSGMAWAWLAIIVAGGVAIVAISYRMESMLSRSQNGLPETKRPLEPVLVGTE